MSSSTGNSSIAQMQTDPRSQPIETQWISDRRKRLTIADFLHTDFSAEFGKDVRQGLSRRQKSVPSKYFYDARGSRLFEEICRLPEYYPTRLEISILQAAAPAIMAYFERQPGDLVEIGCGADLKIRQLLERGAPADLSHIRYMPMDISASCLLATARRLLHDFRGLKVHGLIADFTRHLDCLPKGRKMIAFFGSSFGNFTVRKGIDLLKRLAGHMEPQDQLLLGLDMIKDQAALEAAYNDSRGVTAAFNLNILNHINRAFAADFDPNGFEHQACWNAPRERIEMHLRARHAQRVRLDGLGLNASFAAGETIHTEISQKFSRRSAEKRFHQAGLQATGWHTDADSWFSLVVLRKAG